MIPEGIALIKVGRTFAIIDSADYELLSQYVWRTSPHGYARTTVTEGEKEREVVMHRLLVETEFFVDHINHNRLDNRRSNLRPVTNAENQQNRRSAPARSKTGIRGVTFEHGRYRARVRIKNKRIEAGRHRTIEEAELAVKAARAAHMTHSEEALLASAL